MLLHLSFLFSLLVFLANPQARTSLPTKAGILLRRCRQSQARPLSITSRSSPALRLQPFHSFPGQTYVSGRDVCTLAAASGDGGVLQSRVLGLCVVVMLVRAAAGGPPLPPNTGWGLFSAQKHLLSRATITLHPRHSSGECRRERISAGKAGSLFLQAVVVLNW